MNKWNLREEALDQMLIAAHRGIAGGNIPCNTIAAFDAALYQGADMIELDVAERRCGAADGGSRAGYQLYDSAAR